MHCIYIFVYNLKAFFITQWDDFENQKIFEQVKEILACSWISYYVLSKAEGYGQYTSRFLAHSADVIEMNNGKGLAQLSESPLESCHKILRRTRLNSARMTCLGDNLTDVFGHLWMYASPQIRHQSPKKNSGHKMARSTSDDELLKSFINEIEDSP